ncbi:MAG: hypothetical protein FWD21_03485, partial [Peptococcaceae bacterium]|nr:hypothetical protein [Peptococcaceae bacterium]
NPELTHKNIIDGTPPIFSTDDLLDSTDDPHTENGTFSARFYYTEDAAQTFKYKTIPISEANMVRDSVLKMKEINNIEIDDLWCEGSSMFIDLNINERNALNAGSSAKASIVGCIVRTFMTYPNVKKVELLLGGEKGAYGVHYDFTVVYIKIEGKIIAKLENGMESDFQSWVLPNAEEFDSLNPTSS